MTKRFILVMISFVLLLGINPVTRAEDAAIVNKIEMTLDGLESGKPIEAEYDYSDYKLIPNDDFLSSRDLEPPKTIIRPHENGYAFMQIAPEDGKGYGMKYIPKHAGYYNVSVILPQIPPYTGYIQLGINHDGTETHLGQIHGTGTSRVTQLQIKEYGVHKFDGINDYLIIYDSRKDGGKAFVSYPILLELVQELDVSEVRANGSLTSGVISYGTDCIDVVFNNKLAADTSSFVAKLYSADNKEIKSDMLITEDTLRLELNEALIENETYKLCVTNIKDKFDQTLNDKEIMLKTDGAVPAQLPEILVSYGQNESGTAVIKGKLIGTHKKPISGRKVELYVTIPSAADEISTGLQAITGDDGAFEFRYVFTEDSDGTYKFIPKSAFCQNETGTSYINIAFMGKNQQNAMFEALKKCVDAFAVKNLFNTYEVGLGIDVDRDVEGLDAEYIFDEFAGQEYDSIDQLIRDYYTAICLERINQATNSEQIREVLNNTDTCNYLSIDENILNMLDYENQTELVDNILALDRIENAEVMKKQIDDLLNKELKKQYAKTDANINISVEEAYRGQTLYFEFSFDTEQTDVLNVQLEIGLTDGNSEMLKEAVFTSTQDTDVTTELKDSKLYVYVTMKQKGNLTKLGKLSVNAVNGMRSADTVNVSGTIAFAPEGVAKKILANINNCSTAYKIKEQSTSYTKPSGSGWSMSSGNINKPQETTTPSKNPQPEEQVIFDDIENVEWAKESIIDLYRDGIISGVGDNKFNPNDEVTREEFVKMLVLALNIHDNTLKTYFSDTDNDAWYNSYLASAVKYELISGIGNNMFGVGEKMTREDMAVVLNRSLKYPTDEDTEKYSDDAVISAYAKDAVYAMKQAGIMRGVENNCFAPKANVTRAMAAKVIYEMRKLVKK